MDLQDFNHLVHIHYIKINIGGINLKLKFKNYKYFLYFLTSIYTLTLIIFLVYSGYTYIEIKNSEIKTNKEYLSNFSDKINSLLSSFDNAATQIAMLPSVNTFLYDTEKRDISSYYRINKDLEIFSSNRMYSSIYLYFIASNQVISTESGIENINEFYEKDFFKDLSKIKGGFEIYPYRTIKREFRIPEEIRVLTFVRKVPLFSSFNGYVLINVSFDSLTNSIAALLPDELNCVYITKGETPVFSTLDKNLDLSQLNLSNKVIKVDNKSYILSSSKLTQYGFDVYSLLSLKTINNIFIKKLQVSIGVLLIILFLEFLLSLFLSVLVAKPLDKLIKKILTHNPRLLFQNEVSSSFDGLNHAIDGLLKYEDDILSVVSANMPILKESAMLGLIWGNDFSSHTENHFNQYGLNFDKKYYNVIICSIPDLSLVKNRGIIDQIKLYVKEHIIHVYICHGNIDGVLIEKNKLAFILNSDLNIYENKDYYQNIHNLAWQVKQHIQNEFSVNLVLSVGSTETETVNIHRSFLYADNNLIYSSSFNDECIVFCNNDSGSLALDRLPYSDLVTHIINKDTAQIESYICTFVEKCLEDAYEDGQIKKMLITLISSVYIELWEKGINVSTNNLTLSLSKVSSISDFKKLYPCIIDIVRNITSEIGQDFDEQQNKKIKCSLDFISKNYHRDVSIVEIANFVGLNHIYLNRIFKLSTGKTLSEYLNIYRIEQSKELLKETNEPVGEISKKVGYNDVRSFIRFFKKFIGQTPNDYRTSLP